MTTKRQCVLIVLDSVGIGSLPDAADFGDDGADTLGHIAEREDGLALPNLQRLGLGNISRDEPLVGCPPAPEPAGAFGKMTEVALGKDTTTGHWELMGLVLDEPLRSYPDGFPDAMIGPFLERTGLDGVLGNKAASGTVILEELGEEHLRTGQPIVYTSADPVWQIAAHEEKIGLDTIYRWCEVAYEIAVDNGLSRVIARPFVGEERPFRRTHNRKDFAMSPPNRLVLDALEDAGVHVHGVGKIPNIYSDRGIASERHTKSNRDGIDATLAAMRSRDADLVFTNLVDFDMLYGHRRNVEGYHACLQAFDARLPEILDQLGPADLLIITADHGNDPTWRGTDHTREYVPLLVVGDGVTPGASLGVRDTFADVGATVAELFDVPWDGLGSSFLDELSAG